MTTRTVECPRCNQVTESQENICEHCGVNIALAAVLAEQTLKGKTGLLRSKKLAPEVLVPRLGDYLIERDLLTPDDLIKALAYQRNMKTSGVEMLIGQALLELSLITREKLDQVITEQILQLQTALKEANDELEMRVLERTAELEDALQKLSELNQLKSNFISNVSHELRTPLTHIRGYLELLEDGALGELNPQQADSVRVMRKAEARLGNLIEDLIQFSAFAQGSIELTLVDFSLGDLLGDIIAKAESLCAGKGLEFQAKIPEQLPAITADPQRLPWVLGQLIDNAVKFTEQGGVVQLGAKEQDRMITMYIYDTGIGIAEERLEEIFEPFHQLDSSSTRRFGGTGLGLSMVRQIVRAHGSDMIVRSKEGEGSYFEFAIPIANGNE